MIRVYAFRTGTLTIVACLFSFQPLSFLALLQFPLPLLLLAVRLFRVGVDEIHGGSDALRNGKLNRLDRAVFALFEQDAFIKRRST